MDRKEAESYIRKYLKKKRISLPIICGIMANIEAESDFRSNLAEKAKRGGMTSEEYTAAVDQADYRNFVVDGIGYGLCQWTYYTRKAELLRRCTKRNVSISDVKTQLQFMLAEMKAKKDMWAYLEAQPDSRDGAYWCGHKICMDYERPSAKDISSPKRGVMAAQYYDRYKK